MHMVVLAIEFHQLGFEVPAHIRQNLLHRDKVLILEHVAPKFCYNQMDVQRKDAVSTVPQVTICLARMPHSFSLAIVPMTNLRSRRWKP